MRRSTFHSTLISTLRIALVGAVTTVLAAACASEESPATANCTAAGYSRDAVTESFCGCKNAFVRCSSAGASATREDCVCPAEAAKCPSASEGLVFCAERTGYQCTGGTFKSVLECPGTAECFPAARDGLRCGTTQRYIDYAIEGQPCAGEQGASCSMDQTVVLNCQRGTWVSARTCSGGIGRCERVFQGDPGVNCAGNAPSCYGCASL